MTIHLKGDDELPSLFPRPFPWLESLYFSTLRLYYRCRTHVTLNGFCGHDIRGSIGNHLKSYMNCNLDRDADCRDCPPSLQRDCLYHRLFEHGGNRPKPFVLRLDPAFHTMRTVQRKGDVLWVDLTLIGNAVYLSDYIVDAMRRYPIRLGDKDQLFDLVSEGYVNNDGSIMPFDFGQQAPLMGLATSSDDIDPALPSEGILKFISHTPSEITDSHAHFVHDPNELKFKILMLRMSQRTRSLAAQYCDWQDTLKDDEQKVNREAIDAAEAIELTDCSDAGWKAAGARNKPKGKRGGLVGGFRFEGRFENFVGLFYAAESLGLGKGCTCGFGQVSFHLYSR